MNENEVKMEIRSSELALKAAGCPTAFEARQVLCLSVDQFCKLLDISKATYWAWFGGEKQPSIHQKIFLKEAIRIAKEKGFI